jgi:acyl carrier protein
MDDAIRKILGEHGRIPVGLETFSRDADLYEAGMTSHASVSVMLALEDRFDVEFPQEMLKPSVFGSIAAISAALSELGAQAPAA